jgi:Uma2 family endonuclease
MGEVNGAKIESMSVATHLTGAEELLAMPDDGYRYELIQGELRRTPPAGGPHGNAAMEIGSRLAEYVRAEKLGVVFAAETGFRLTSNPDTVRAPDAAFVSRERIERIGIPKGYWPGAPDLAVEVVSPGDTFTEVAEKVIDWLTAGTKMVLVLNPEKRTVSVYRGAIATLLLDRDTLSGEDVAPGWSVAVRDLFG